MLRRAISKLLVVVALSSCFSMTVMAATPTTYDVPSNSSFKAYMDYRAITNTRSKQYKIQQQCQTTAEGLRTYKGYYTVAVGTGFDATTGDYIDVELEGGTILHCIIGDMKQNKHTDVTNMQVAGNGNVVEFIVDTDCLDEAAKSRGDVSLIHGFEGYVKSITVLGSADIETESIQTNEVQPIVTDEEPEYLIMGKSELPMDNGETLYSVDYIFCESFNSIVCTEEFYNSVSLGDTVTALE